MEEEADETFSAVHTPHPRTNTPFCHPVRVHVGIWGRCCAVSMASILLLILKAPALLIMCLVLEPTLPSVLRVRCQLCWAELLKAICAAINSTRTLLPSWTSASLSSWY